MNSLDKLTGQKVKVRIENDEDTIHYIVGKVLSVDIKDYYFYDNGVHVYITVSIDPLEELNSNIDPESLVDIPLNCITKY